MQSNYFTEYYLRVQLNPSLLYEGISIIYKLYVYILLGPLYKPDIIAVLLII